MLKTIGLRSIGLKLLTLGLEPLTLHHIKNSLPLHLKLVRTFYLAKTPRLGQTKI